MTDEEMIRGLVRAAELKEQDEGGVLWDDESRLALQEARLRGFGKNKMKCGIPARTLPPCDEEWGHDGDMHGNAGDGFYAHEYDAEHHRRQRERRQRGVK
jgi:hypothetical protein